MGTNRILSGITEADHLVTAFQKVTTSQVTTLTASTVNGAGYSVGTAGTPGTNATAGDPSALGLRVETIDLAALQVSVDSDDDFGSTIVYTFPNTSVVVAAIKVSITGTGDGAVITDETAVDAAFGTGALASTDFSGNTEQNLVAEADVAEGGVLTVVGMPMLALAKSATNRIYLNNQVTLASGTGTMDWTGSVTIYYFDFGA